jgi:hypothetical protein
MTKKIKKVTVIEDEKKTENTKSLIPKNIKKKSKGKIEPKKKLLFDSMQNIQKEIESIVNGNQAIIIARNKPSSKNSWYLIGYPREMEVVRHYNMSAFQPTERRETKSFFVAIVIKVGDFEERSEKELTRLKNNRCPIYIVNSINKVRDVFSSL